MKKRDKLIMGTIIGGAIGSVLGLLVAPKSGKETRQDIAKKSKVYYKKGKAFGNRMQEQHGEKAKTTKSLLKKLLFGTKSRKK